MNLRGYQKEICHCLNRLNSKMTLVRWEIGIFVDDTMGIDIKVCCGRLPVAKGTNLESILDALKRLVEDNNVFAETMVQYNLASEVKAGKERDLALLKQEKLRKFLSSLTINAVGFLKEVPPEIPKEILWNWEKRVDGRIAYLTRLDSPEINGWKLVVASDGIHYTREGVLNERNCLPSS